jgi:hypothetical protein
LSIINENNRNEHNPFSSSTCGEYLWIAIDRISSSSSSRGLLTSASRYLHHSWFSFSKEQNGTERTFQFWHFCCSFIVAKIKLLSLDCDHESIKANKSGGDGGGSRYENNRKRTQKQLETR